MKQPTYAKVPLQDLSGRNDSDPPHNAQRLRRSRTTLAFSLLFDLLLAVLAFLFAIFGLEVYLRNGDPATEGSFGLKLFQAAQIAPTIFPILFAAIVGGGIKSIASWLIQSRHGITLGVVGQCLGSQTISSAFVTQIRLRALNLVGLLIICLWALSPVGSQASLRVISVVPAYYSYSTELRVVNTSPVPLLHLSYADLDHLAIPQILELIRIPTTSSMMAPQLLSSQNQDIWGSIRVPAIEPLEIGGRSNAWHKAPNNTDLTYPSLIGIPVSVRPGSGNTSFIFPASYLSLSCPLLHHTNQSNFTDFDSLSSATDVWRSSKDGCDFYQVAISPPYYNSTWPKPNAKRKARSLIWEQRRSWAEWNYAYARAECSLTTTFVDANVTCTAALSGNSCNVLSVRRSVDPPYPENFTVLDIGLRVNEDLIAYGATDYLVNILTTMFPATGRLDCGSDFLNSFLQDPTQVLEQNTEMGGVDLSTMDKDVFARRVEQLLNSVLYIAIDPSSFTGRFNGSLSVNQTGFELNNSVVDVNGTTIIERDAVQCNMAWLGLLIVTSLILFFFVLVTAFLHLFTLAPEILGFPSVALLRNKVAGVQGSSTWSWEEWAKESRDLKLYLGDVEPEERVGRIALATEGQAARIQAERYFV